MTDHSELTDALEAAGLLQDEYPDQMAARSCTCETDATCGAHRLLERYDALFAAFQESNREKREQRVRAMDAIATVEQTRRERDARDSVIRRYLDGWHATQHVEGLWAKDNLRFQQWEPMSPAEVDAVRRARAGTERTTNA